MAIDGLFLHFLTEELREKLIDGRVDKIYQTQKTELVLSIKTREDRFKLLLSASGNCPRIHITSSSIENPPNPPMLCMLLRKKLTGAFIRSIDQLDLDRVVRINFLATDELGDKCELSLVIEIMAQYSNIILLNENDVVIDAVKRVDESKSSVRLILPGVKYENPPSQDKVDIRDCDVEQIVNTLENFGVSAVQKWILNTFQGICPANANEIAYRAESLDEPCSSLDNAKKEKLIFELEILKSNVARGKCTPYLIFDPEKKPRDLSYLSGTIYGTDYESRPYKTFSELTDDFYREKETFQRTKTKAADLFHRLNSLIERTSRRIDAQSADLKKTESADEKRVFGELINANLYRLDKGKKSYTVENFYDEFKPVSIPVDEDKTPTANAQKYFKEYKKLITARATLTDLIDAGKADLQYLQSVLDELSRAETEREINEIRAELRETGFLKNPASGKKVSNAKLPPLEFTSPSGFSVSVGRNNLQNDRLSLKASDKDDLWFHIQKAPGSHVVLHCSTNEVTDDDIHFCCQTAAYFSSARQSSKVEIDSTRIRNLKKPNGSKPGFVIYYIYESYLDSPKNPEEYGLDKGRTDR